MAECRERNPESLLIYLNVSIEKLNINLQNEHNWF